MYLIKWLTTNTQQNNHYHFSFRFNEIYVSKCKISVYAHCTVRDLARVFEMSGMGLDEENPGTLNFGERLHFNRFDVLKTHIIWVQPVLMCIMWCNFLTINRLPHHLKHATSLLHQTHANKLMEVNKGANNTYI